MKLRKQTLGQIFNVLKKEADILILTDELDNYLKRRNLLIHDLWRTYYRNDSSTYSKSEAINFCKTFLEDSSKYENFYKGFLYSIARYVAKANKLSIPENITLYREHNRYFISCLQHDKLI